MREAEQLAAIPTAQIALSVSEGTVLATTRPLADAQGYMA